MNEGQDAPMPGEERPWGRFDILETGAGYQVKRLLVNPGCRLSYQSHLRRSERWIVASGVAEVTLEGAVGRHGIGSSIGITRKAKHRLANPGTVVLIVIEIQLGSYLGEDDIIRYEDDFGRCVV